MKPSLRSIKIFILLTFSIAILAVLNAGLFFGSAMEKVPAELKPGIGQLNDSGAVPGPTTFPSEVRYINKAFGSKFTYPRTWNLKEEEQAVMLTKDTLKLRIEFAREARERGSGFLGRSGSGLGNLIYSGTAYFMNLRIPIQTVKHGGSEKGVLYNGGRWIAANNMAFKIVLENLAPDDQTREIPEQVHAEVLRIAASFQELEAVASAHENNEVRSCL